LKLKEFFDEKPVNYFFDNQNRGLLSVTSFEPKSIKFFKREIDNFFKEVDLRNCNDVFVDLRDNHGGYVRAQEYLLSYLNYKKLNHEIEYVYKRSDYDRFSLMPFYQKWQFRHRAKKVYPNGVLSKEFDFFKSENGNVKKIIYDYLPKNDLNKTYSGKCTLLMNGFSMSASVLFAGWFKSSERGEIIGSPCLGTLSGTFGNSAQIRLSETGLPIMIATLKFNPQHSKNIKLQAIQPDKNISYSVEDIKLRRDPVFQFLKIGVKSRIN
jgi:C-terminal processing protease CtpA/Prc